MKYYPVFLTSFLILQGCATPSYELHTFEHIQLSDTFWTEGATFGDVTGDGMPDLVAGPYIYEGPDFENKHAIYEPASFSIETYSDNFFAYVDDINQDGRNDILFVGFPGEASYWYENTGELNSHWPRHLIIGEVSNESPVYTDITGDGINELVCINSGRYGYAQPDLGDPRGMWSFTPISEDRGLQKFTHGMGVGDVNNDGRMDLMEREGWYEQPADLSSGELWTHHAFAFAEVEKGGSQMFAYDFDGDGDNDIMTSLYAHGYGLTLYKNVGQPDAPIFDAMPIMTDEPAGNPYGVAFSQLHAMALEDIDGDGIKDLITGKRFWAHMGKDPGGTMPPVLYWFKTSRLDDGGVDFIPYKIGESTGVGTQVVVKDANNDGLSDIAIGNKKGTAVYIHHKNSVAREAWEAAQPERLANP